MTVQELQPLVGEAAGRSIQRFFTRNVMDD
jgi:hypothetical protein